MTSTQNPYAASNTPESPIPRGQVRWPWRLTAAVIGFVLVTNSALLGEQTALEMHYAANIAALENILWHLPGLVITAALAISTLRVQKISTPALVTAAGVLILSLVVAAAICG